MPQSTSTIGKVTRKNVTCINKRSKNRGVISFRLHIPGFHQDNLFCLGNTYMIELSSTHVGACCPCCHHFSKHLKGHYSRSLQEVEIWDHPVTLLVQVRKFRCKNTCCPQKVFSESLVPLSYTHARHTFKVEERISEVSLKTTSRISSELLHRQNIFCSPSTCLRRVRKKASDETASPAPVAIGIDDFAQKKGHIYGSVIVDQLTHQPVKLLPSREGTELEKYLAENPQIQYITRDRGRCFVEAINRVLPGATQICDRFHLIKNMTDSMTEEIAFFSRLDVCKRTYTYPSAEQVRERIMKALLNMGDAKHRHKLNLFIAADDCIRRGMSIAETAKQLGEHSQVIWRLVRKRTRKDYMSARQKNVLRHIDVLSFEIGHGCAELKKLKEKMKNAMSASDVTWATLDIRNEIKQEKMKIREYNKSIAERKNKKHASIKAIRHFILHGESKVESLCDLLNKPEIKNVIKLCGEFREMVNGNPKQRSLDKWISKATASESESMRCFATGIKLDQQAVQNAMDIYLNNGLLEGTVNKVKCIKRMMFNRAGYELLNIKLKGFKT